MTFIKCSVEQCDRNAHYAAKGIGGHCANHAYRFKKYGDPLAGRTASGEPRRYLEIVLAYRGDDCLIWPYARNSAGYGHLHLDGRDTLVHRHVCEKVYGPPEAGNYAAHSCGNGHLGCCNQRHLRWATPASNSNDMLGHGTRVMGERQHGAKLTDEAVRDIRQSQESQRALATKYGVTPSNISYVLRGNTWKHVA